MKRLRISSPFNAVKEHGLVLVIGAWIILSANQWKLSAFVFSAALFLLIANDKKAMPAVIILAVYLLPYGHSDPLMRQGRVIQVRKNYVIVEQNLHKMILYTDFTPILDSTIRFDGAISAIYPSNGFYRFDYASYCKRQGITISLTPDKIEVIKPSCSLRGHLT